MYDLVIRNGTLVDGTGLPRYRANVGIVGDRIATIGRVREKGAAEIDATGQVVSPGFVDGHTHMDAQVFWDDVRYLIHVMDWTGRGILELARERDSMRSKDPAVRGKYNDLLRALAIEDGVAITFGIPPVGPGMKEKFLSLGSEVVGSTPAKLDAAMKADIARMSKVIKDANI